MEPIESPDEISNIAFGFMASKALLASLHLDLFGALADGPRNLADLAKAVDVTESRLETLVTALVSIGLLGRDGAMIGNSPASSRYLVRQNPDYFGDYLRYQIDLQMYPNIANLDHVLHGELDRVTFPSYAEWMADQEQAELFSRSQHSGSLGPGAVLARRVELAPDATRMLDVGGGSGAFSIMFCKSHPDLRATVLDFPNVIEVGRRFVAEAGLGDRIEFLAGDGTSHGWPEGQDLVLMSYLLSGVPEAAISDLCVEASRVLNPGGVLAIHDFMVRDDRTGPPLAALWQLQHMVYTPDGVGLTPSHVMDEIRRAGLEIVSNGTLIPGMTRAIVGRKPSGV